MLVQDGRRPWLWPLVLDESCRVQHPTFSERVLNNINEFLTLQFCTGYIARRKFESSFDPAEE